MSEIVCSECHDLIDTNGRTIVFPFVCDECQKAPELLAAMAPLRIEDSDNISCGCTSDETTGLLIEDLSNQLEISKVEAETLRTLLLAAEERNTRLRKNMELAFHGVLELAVENDKLEAERYSWQKRALIAKRCYDLASAGRRYYRGKLKDAGIKA